MVPVGLSRGRSESLRHAKGYKKMGGGMLERELRGHAVGRENAGVGGYRLRDGGTPPRKAVHGGACTGCCSRVRFHFRDFRMVRPVVPSLPAAHGQEEKRQWPSAQVRR